MTAETKHGILLLNKPKGITSFRLVAQLRRILNIKKIGHAGTLDPFATGVMVMLIGRNYTRLSDLLLNKDKEYIAELTLGAATDTYDHEGQITATNTTTIPTKEEILNALKNYQGEIQQTPPMFSAKKINGQKLYTLARQGKEVPRQKQSIHIQTTLLSYNYPTVTIHVTASKGTYIRSLAHDIGQDLKCHAHLTALQRTRSGPFSLENCIDGTLNDATADAIIPHLIKSL